ncbi:hypothetical protein PLICRDRAFT_51441 [Plicaturopsis crispa FD-325 SS-3]|nr:hypothetical protein PLICRDRAFT_51441 [Plicaturopsis crispa FD-325 SS-3]
MSSELGLDPSDPLNMLLHNIPQNGDSYMDDGSPQEGSPPDWSQLSTMWAPQGPMETDSAKFSDMRMDFDLASIDFSPYMSVDPSALDLNPHRGFPQHPNQLDMSYSSVNDLLTPAFPFTFSLSEGSVSSSDTSDLKPRRLSVTSSSSSSGASLSPIMAPAMPAEVTPADELAQRARQAAGVMLAVSAGEHAQQASTNVNTMPKMPIPRLARPTVPAKNGRESAKASTSGSSSGTGSPSPSGSNSPAPEVSFSASGRPKTSHTTIERRYRTNLNARIQSLRQAVPALRVLEDRSKGKPDADNMVDDRGFVDGVKVARKGSKANVLGKAVEYIRVLKKREARLKREQNGLKSLVAGLVGGPALLKEWEREWVAKFGGEEKDEVEGDEAESDDDEDGDEEGEGEDDDGGRAKKKAKVTKPPKKDKKVSEVATGEKRKRGRPRKNAAPASIVSVPENLASAQAVKPETETSPNPPAQQYLLATFALFSFFNSPFDDPAASSSSRNHSHSGSVVAPRPAAAVPLDQSSFGWRDFTRFMHLLVTALLFLSIVLPWLPPSLKRSRIGSYIFGPFSSITSGASTAESRSPASGTPVKSRSTDKRRKHDSLSRTALIDALATTCRGSPDEAIQLREALGIYSGPVGLAQALFTRGKRSRETFEQKQLEQRAWVRLGELVAMDPSISTATRLQTYWCMRSHVPWFKASTSDLSTLALIMHPLSPSKADALWSRALRSDFVRPFERLVLENMRVEEAIARLAAQPAQSKAFVPLGILAGLLIRERIRSHASSLFVRTVLPDHGPVDNEGSRDDSGMYSYDVENDRDHEEDLKRKATIEAGKSLGGRTRELAELLERVWDTGFCAIESGGEDDVDSTEAEIRSLLHALVLYRRIFPSSIMTCASADAHASAPSVAFILSPPPSPSRKDADLHLALKTVLGSPAFELPVSAADDSLGVALDDAKDRVLDMLFDCDRAARRAEF